MQDIYHSEYTKVKPKSYFKCILINYKSMHRIVTEIYLKMKKRKRNNL